MLAEEALQQLLRLDGGVSAIAGTRIYPSFLPQTVTYPAIAYRREGLERVPNLDSPVTWYTRETVRFFSAAQGPDRYGTAARLDAAIRTCLEGYIGTVISDSTSPAETLAIIGIFATELAGDDYHDPSQTHQFISEFDVFF